MTRYARIHVTGGLFHVISRFHDKRFYSNIEGARAKYLELLGKAAQSHDSRVVAYCLMSSHVHLVLQLGNDTLGMLTKKVHSPFSHWVNQQRSGVGAVFADRPKSVLVHSETYGMELLRYVHNNPVRAGLVERASQSDWSSHRAYLGLDPAPKWLAMEAVFGDEAGDREAVRKEFESYVDEGRSEGRRSDFGGDVPRERSSRIRKLMGGDVTFSYPVLGPDSFVISSLKEQASRRRDKGRVRTSELGIEGILEGVYEELGVDPGLCRQRVKTREVVRGRELVAWLWSEKMGRPQVTIAEAMNLRPSAITKMLTKLRRDGLTAEDESIVERVFGAMVREEEPRGPGDTGEPEFEDMSEHTFVPKVGTGHPA
jgi:putative transposase